MLESWSCRSAAGSHSKIKLHSNLQPVQLLAVGLDSLPCPSLGALLHLAQQPVSAGSVIFPLLPSHIADCLPSELHKLGWGSPPCVNPRQLP